MCVQVFVCPVCHNEFEYGNDNGYSRSVCGPVCDGVQAGRAKVVRAMLALAVQLRAKGDEHGDSDAGLAFEACASSIERVCDEVSR